MTFANTSASVHDLKQQVTWNVSTPEDAGYAAVLSCWRPGIEHHPALILVPQTVEDVSAGVRYARDTGLGVSVISTGHGKQAADDSLLIVTSALSHVRVDTKARTAQAGAGALWKHVIEQAAPHGLAPLLGTAPHVGVVGYTLGGGIGWLARRYGLAADSVRWIDIVTPDGVRRRPSSTENSDLFWGLRGGGGNFGVVTALEFDLYPVATIYGGSLTYPADRARDALRFFRDWTKTAPDGLTSTFLIMKFPPMPQLPEALRGKTLVMLQAAFTGDPAEGEALIGQWLAWGTPLNNTFRAMPFAEIGTISNDPEGSPAAIGSSEMFRDLSDEAIDVMIRCATDPASPLMVSALRHAGGAIKRVDPNANAIGNRDAEYSMQMGGLVRSPAAYEAAKAYIQEYKAALKPYLHGGVYLNFMVGGEQRSRVQDAYLPETYRRLVALKAKYDPDNMFRFSYALGE